MQFKCQDCGVVIPPRALRVVCFLKLDLETNTAIRQGDLELTFGVSLLETQPDLCVFGENEMAKVDKR